MIDRERVGQIIASGNPCYLGEQLLADLEAAGYRVVRAGMVPELAALEDVRLRLEALAPVVAALSPPNGSRVDQAGSLLDSLRQIAVLVLGIDPEDVDP